MKHFNLQSYSYYDFKYTYGKMKKRIETLQNELQTIKKNKLNDNDTISSLQKTLDKDEDVIKGLKEVISDSTNIKPRPIVLDAHNLLKPPSNHSNESGDNLPASIAILQVDAGSHYVITCEAPEGQILYISQYPDSENNSAMEEPNNPHNVYVKFIGKNIDSGNGVQIRLEFTSQVNGTLYLVPRWWVPIKNYELIKLSEPYDMPDFPYAKAVPLPKTTYTEKHPKVDKITIGLLQDLIKMLKQGKVDVADIWHSTDENGDISYRFTADVIRPKWNFLQAVNQLNQTNGIMRAGSTKDYWIALDTRGNLVKKFRGSDRLVPYQPSRSDLDGEDWEVIQTQPYNPDTKPYGSDNWDDLSDSNRYGYDGDTPADGDF